MAYGTIMLGTLATGVSIDEWQKGLEDWKTERKVAGFQAEYTLLGDDNRTIASCVIFESKDAYFALANDPAQDTWWREKVQPLLDGEPQWVDGTWV